MRSSCVRLFFKIQNILNHIRRIYMSLGIACSGNIEISEAFYKLHKLACISEIAFRRYFGVYISSQSKYILNSATFEFRKYSGYFVFGIINAREMSRRLYTVFFLNSMSDLTC